MRDWRKQMVVWLTDSLGTAPCEATLEDNVVKVDVTDLVEGKGNDQQILQAKILECTASLKAGRRVVLCCDRGIVRSNTLAVVVLVSSGLTYKNALALVRQKVGTQAINIDLLNDAVGVVNRIRT